MNIAELIQRGALVGGELVKVEVKWTHPVEGVDEDITDAFFVHIERQSYRHVERMLSSPEDRSRGAQIISEHVRFGDAGEEKMTYEQALALDPGLAAALLSAYNEVNGARRAPKS